MIVRLVETTIDQQPVLGSKLTEGKSWPMSVTIPVTEARSDTSSLFKLPTDFLSALCADGRFDARGWWHNLLVEPLATRPSSFACAETMHTPRTQSDAGMAVEVS